MHVRRNDSLTKVSRVIGIVLLLFMCMQSSVLECLGGNPELGIPSYLANVSTDQPTHTGPTMYSRHASDGDFSYDCDDCFVSCTHTFSSQAPLGFESKAPQRVARANVSRPKHHAAPDKSTEFRPPKAA